MRNNNSNYAQRASYNITLQLVVFAILAVIVPMVVSDYFQARNELKQAQISSQEQVAAK